MPVGIAGAVLSDTLRCPEIGYRRADSLILLVKIRRVRLHKNKASALKRLYMGEISISL